MNRLDLLEKVLSVPTATYHEEYMVEFISNWLKENNIPYVVDEMMNIYATKTSEGFEGKLYPCMVAHTDTVHGMNEIVVHTETLKFVLKVTQLKVLKQVLVVMTSVVYLEQCPLY
jgi:di/tripeptidase